MLEALTSEVTLRTDELPNEPLKSIYFGGGTPSMLSPTEIETLLNSVTLLDVQGVSLYNWNPMYVEDTAKNAGKERRRSCPKQIVVKTK